MRKLTATKFSLPSVFTLALPGLVLAHGSHHLNDGDLPITVAGGLGTFAFMMLLLVMTAAIVSFVFWLVMLVHAASNDIPDKALWLVVLIGSLLLGVWFISAVVYYFAVKKKFDQPAAKAPARQGAAKPRPKAARSRKPPK